MSQSDSTGASRNQRGSIIATAVIAANLIAILMVIGAQFFLVRGGERIQTGWVAVSQESFDTLSVLGETQRILGFGGMIHNFKNYVLRGDDKYHVATVISITRAEENLALLRSRFASATQMAAIDDIADVLTTYRDNLEIARRERKGLSAESVDGLVRINDAPALEAITFLSSDTRQSLAEQQQDMRRDARRRMERLRYGYVIIALLLASSFAYVMLLRRQHRDNRFLSQALQRVDTFIDATPDPIVIVREDGIIERANREAAHAFGYKKEPLEGKSVEALVPEALREKHVGLRARYLENGGQHIMHRSQSLEGLRKDGTRFPMEAKLSSTMVEDRRLITVSIRDISERQRMEEELQRGQRMQALIQLTEGIALDFNKLLQIVSGNAQTIRDGSGDAREAAEHIQDAAENATALTSRLLAFGRQQALHPVSVSPAKLLSGISELLGRTLGPQIELNIEVGEALPDIMIDKGQLENAILNLAINARDAMPDGGKLSIEAEAKHLHIKLYLPVKGHEQAS